jgi:hypothetical protein
MLMKYIKEITKYSVISLVLLANFAIPTVSKAQYYYPLQISCQPNTYSAQVNTTVGWSASGSGGNGVYAYSWSGTDGLSGSANSILYTYTTTGTKTASITVTSNGQSMTANCGSVNIYPVSNYYYSYPYYYNYSSLDGSCSASAGSAQVGTTINWSGYATGGNGTYTYYWNDSDGYSSSGQYLSRYYTYAGLKNMNLTISSNGQSITRTCSVYINPSTIVVNNPTYVYPTQNQVLAYTDTNPNLSSVYLSDIPSTGFNDVAKTALFIFALILWSSILAYMFLKNKAMSEVLVPKKVSADFEIAQTKISKDEEDIKQIEDYARTHKVLLSSEASINLLKFSRLEKIDAAETIRKMAKKDWVAVGENDLEKYL